MIIKIAFNLKVQLGEEFQRKLMILNIFLTIKLDQKAKIVIFNHKNSTIKMMIKKYKIINIFLFKKQKEIMTKMMDKFHNLLIFKKFFNLKIIQ